MRVSMTFVCVAAVAIGGTTACFDGGTRSPRYDHRRTILGPINLKDRIAYVDTGRDRVIIVDVTGSAPRVSTTAIGRGAITAVPAPDRTHLLVITRGEEAIVEGQVDEEPTLWIVDAAAPHTAPSAYPIGSPFDRIAVASDGGVAIAYYAPGTISGDDGVFRNPNELAVIALDRAADATNPMVRALRSFGAAPDGVVLSPPMAIPGAADATPRTFAFVLAANTLTMLDATYPDRDEVSIRLAGDGEPARPREIAFAPASASAYVRSDGARDVLAVQIHADPPQPDRAADNDYRPSLSELGAGGGPADIAWYDDAAGRRFVLAATPRTGELAIIDGDTGELARIATSDPIDRIVLFPTGSGRTPRTALLASLAFGAPRVHLLSLDHIADPLVPVDLRTVDLEQPVRDVVAVPGRDLALIVHDDDRTVLGLLDVAFGAVAPLEGVGRLGSYDFVAGGTYLIGATTQSPRVGILDLDTLHPRDVRLDDLPAQVFALTGGGIYVDHGDPFGRATYLPQATSTREDAVVLSGFLLADLIDEAL